MNIEKKNMGGQDQIIIPPSQQGITKLKPSDILMSPSAPLAEEPSDRMQLINKMNKNPQT